MVDIQTVCVSDLYSLREMRAWGLVIPKMLDIDRLITTWAEYRITLDSHSDNLLILASLNLDKKLDRDDVDRYFSAYLSEKEKSNIHYHRYPVVYLKYFMPVLALAEDIKSCDVLLSMLFVLDINTDFSENTFFKNTLELLRDIYYQHIDVCEYYCPSDAEVLSEDEIVAKITALADRIHKLLSNEKMIALLAGSVM